MKAIRVAGRERRQNQPVKSAAKTYITKARRAIERGEREAVTLAVVQAVGALDRAAQKGVIHPNNAARRKSRLMRHYNAALTKTSDSE